MAANSKQLLVDALARAAADPEGMPLHGGKAALFPSTPSAKEIAQHCKQEDFLQVIRTENRGRSSVEFCRITEKGLAYLLDRVSPRLVLENVLHSLEDRKHQFHELLQAVQQAHHSIEVFRTTTERVLAHISKEFAGNGTPSSTPSGSSPPAEAWERGILSHLDQWYVSGALEDCPLPELYRRVSPITVGQFHDALRFLHDREEIYLHPWTGPLYAIPDPAMALLVGHQIAYYASLRK